MKYACLTLMSLILMSQDVLAQNLGIHIPEDSLRACAHEPLMVTATVSGGQPPYSITWSDGSVGDSILYASAPGGSYLTATVKDVSGNTKQDSVWIHVHNACVWPGDANGDGLADNQDILPLGLALGSSGPVRPDAHLQWMGQPADNWNLHTPDGVDYVHADTDGDGTITNQDVIGIDHNYFQPQTGTGVSGSSISGVPLYVDFPTGNFSPGDTIRASIVLGTALSPADSVYGLAFSVEYDPTLFTPGSLTVTYDSSWLGQYGQDLIAVDRDFPASSQIDIGMTRTDQVMRAGYGTIVTIIVTVDDIAGKNNGIEMVEFGISRVSLLRQSGSPISVSPGFSQVGIALSNEESERFEQRPTLYPNPSSGVVSVQIPNRKWIGGQMHIYDLTGRIIMEEKIRNRELYLDLSAYQSGPYFVIINRETQQYSMILKLE